MTKRLLTLPLIALLFACNGSSSDNNNVQNRSKRAMRYGWQGELYGDVESIVERDYDVRNRLHGEEFIPTQTETIKFNEHGHVDAIYRDTDCDDIIDNTIIYQYDERNHVVGYVHSYKDENIGYTAKYETDDRGNITLEAYYNKIGISQFGLRTIYNSDNQPIEISHYNENSELKSKELIKYYHNGEIESCVEYNADGKIKYEFNTTLNSRGNISSIYYIHYDDKGKIEDIIEQEYYYNEQGQLIKLVNINKPKREYHEQCFEYDSKGNVVKIMRYESEARILQTVNERSITYRN